MRDAGSESGSRASPFLLRIARSVGGGVAGALKIQPGFRRRDSIKARPHACLLAGEQAA